MKNTVTAERVRELLDFNPATGVPVYRVSRHRARAGEIAGYIRGDNKYRSLFIDGRRYYAHRLAWLHFYGRWPVGQLDHINGLKDDNRIANLRECTTSENQQNRTAQQNSASGLLGAHWDKRGNNWLARICANGRRRHIGTFPTAHEAHAAYLAAKQRLHTFQPIPRQPLETTP